MRNVANGYLDRMDDADVADVATDRLYSRFGKRAFDVLLALALLPFLTPIIAVLWLIVRFEGAPGFFGHPRIGQNGRVFRCWKVRTMTVGAEAKLADYLSRNPEAAREWALNQKLSDDPRITKLGRFLRKSSLDELPQIWNVLKGEMSFVGPRPVVPDELERYGNQRETYLSLKPGITGFWQTLGRNSLSYGERVKLDTAYVSQISLSTDIRLILKTAALIVIGNGK